MDSEERTAVGLGFSREKYRRGRHDETIGRATPIPRFLRPPSSAANKHYSMYKAIGGQSHLSAAKYRLLRRAFHTKITPILRRPKPLPVSLSPIGLAVSGGTTKTFIKATTSYLVCACRTGLGNNRSQWSVVGWLGRLGLAWESTFVFDRGVLRADRSSGGQRFVDQLRYFSGHYLGP